jgi:hypothetical protein
VTKEDTPSIVSITTSYHEWSIELTQVKFLQIILCHIEIDRIEYSLVESRIHGERDEEYTEIV